MPERPDIKDDRSLTVNGTTYGLMDKNFENVQKALETAFVEGTGCSFDVIDGANRIVTLYINARIVDTVVVNTELRARPHEI